MSVSGYFNKFRNDEYDLGSGLVKNVTNLTKYAAIFSDIADDVSFYSFYNMNYGQRLDSISSELYGTPDYYWTIPLINKELVNTWQNLPMSINSLTHNLSKRYPGIVFPIRNDQNLAGLFSIGEVLADNSTNTAEILNLYPTRGYIHAQPLDDASFAQNVELTLTGQTSGNSIVVNNAVAPYLAPLRHEDADGNIVTFDTPGAVPVTILNDANDRNEEYGQIKVIRPEYIFDVVSLFERAMRGARR